MAVLLCCSAFFSAAETALFSLSRRDLHGIEHSPGLVHRLIVRLRSEPQALLMTVLFGNMVVNVLYYSLATLGALAAARAGWRGAVYGLGIGSLLVLIVCGEVGPKAVAVTIPMRFAHLAAVPLFFFQTLIYPVRRVLGVVMKAATAVTRGPARGAYVTAEELHLLIHATGERGVIAHTERDMMHDIIEFAQIPVREVMVPRVDVVAFEVNGDLADFCDLIRRRRIGNVPVYEGNIDNVIGFVYSRDVLLGAPSSIRECMHPVPLFVPDTARIEPVLHQFRERKSQFAIVVDEYGGCAGIVTLEDIVEEIVGDIRDEFDALTTPVRSIGPDQYVLSGSLGIRDWSGILGVEIGRSDVKTLGGFVVQRLGRLPREGDVIRFRNLILTVQKVSRRRVAEVLIERVSAEDLA